MKFSKNLFLVAGALLGGHASAEETNVSFNWFEYRGNDSVFATPLPTGSYRNPILAGFYPDPSICRAGDDFYLVNSSFAYTPGIPIFKSHDLVHWQQIGNVISRPNELKFDGLGVSRGVFAPDIEFHEGVFYVLNTAVDSGGNFLVTATNPAGPWSEPHWLPEIDGIDPSFFFDQDGKAYIVNNGSPEGTPLYTGHRAIWIQEFDLTAGKLVGPRKVLVNGGTDLAKKPIWIEGPHLFQRDHWYYLMCAEGGTSQDHSEVVFRSRSPWGPFVSYEKNPILTQRDLPDSRANPVSCAGHADLVEAPDGSWWASFLGCRAYQADRYNTGRETFLLPVSWQDDWPVILPAGQPVPYVASAPKLSAGPKTDSTFPLNGNFTLRDNFDQPTLNLDWMFLRDSHVEWADLKTRPGFLTIHPLAASLAGKEQPSFLARRQQHANFTATTSMVAPKSDDVSAGIALFQNEMYHFFFGLRRHQGGFDLFLERANAAAPQVLAHQSITLKSGEPIQLKVEGAGPNYSFLYQVKSGDWISFVQNADGTILSTAVAGGFVGATLGPYARLEATIPDTPAKF